MTGSNGLNKGCSERAKSLGFGNRNRGTPRQGRSKQSYIDSLTQIEERMPWLLVPKIKDIEHRI